MTTATDPALMKLAQHAGILVHWQDATGRPQQVADDVIRYLLDALGLACRTPAQITDSLQQLDDDQHVSDGALVVVRCGERPSLRCDVPGSWTLALESGQVLSGVLRQDRPGRVSLDPITQPGYHRLQLGQRTVTLAVVPRYCPTVPAGPVGQSRPWGLVAQIYSLHQSHDPFPAWSQGGNFSAAGRLAAEAARAGASALALSPAHAMFSADPGRYSPYSPSSRLWLNVNYADPIQVLGGDIVCHALRGWTHDDLQWTPGPLLDWPRIASLRLRLLRRLFECFHDQGPAELKGRLASFRRDQGRALQDHATYEALHEHYVPELGAGHGWQDWPVPFHDPAGAAVAEFATRYAKDVDFHVFAQWLASETLQQAQDGARAAGMSCGLISDLAIGTDPRGSHAWSLQDDILTSVSVGAPPDVYQAQGQNWGLTAFSPRGLRRGAYGAFIETLRASLRGAGGIRIDHIAGMERLWLIPAGATASEGAYLAYPRRDLLGLITLEARRHDAIVIGENLGTVSDELNRSLIDHGMLGTNVLWFERDDATTPAPDSDDPAGNVERPCTTSASSFRASACWTETAIAMPTTHDLPTLNGWWQERDLQWKALLDAQTRTERQVVQDERHARRLELWQAIQDDDATPEQGPPHDTPLSQMLAFVAATPAPLALFPLEDVLGVLDQPNIPGGDGGWRLVQHPNWLQRLPVSVDDAFSQPDVSERVARIVRSRSTP